MSGGVQARQQGWRADGTMSLSNVRPPGAKAGRVAEEFTERSDQRQFLNVLC